MEWLAVVVALITGLFASVSGLINPLMTYIAAPQSAPKEASIVFVGDMMFDRTIRQYAEAHGDDYLLSCADPMLLDADLVVGNLEGPITTYPSKSVNSVIRSPENYTFTFPTSTAALLYRHNIRLVNLGNNHIANFSRDGMVQTKEWLEKAGVQYFGDPMSPEADRVARIEINGIRFSFINWSDWTSDKTDHTVAQVKAEKEAGRITVVYTHWGDEYVDPSERVKTLARQFVDAGADIVIGSHPHVILESELYKDRHIYYSLGNFVFDQYWNERVSTGLALTVAFDASGVRGVGEQLVKLGRDRRTCLID